MARNRQEHVIVALGAVAIFASIAACSSDASPNDTPATSTSVTTTAEAGNSDASDGQPEDLPPEPPEPVCTLTGPPAATPGDVLVNAQDFDTATLDPLTWTVRDGYRGHSTIANTASAANAVIHDGSLFITTERDTTNPTYPYRSGWIDSLDKYARTYGKIEIRARFPPFAAGVWYAMWGRPWSQPFPEIDIELMNIPGKKKTQVYFVNHWAAPPLPADERRSYTVFDTIDVTQFHTYTVLWKPDVLEWSVDGVVKMQAPPQGIPNLPVYWMINGWVGGWGGAPSAATPFPATFEVDYVHVYRVDGLIAEPAIKIVDPQPSYKRADAIEVAIANFDEACAHVELRDADQRVWTTSTRPYRFPLSHLRRAGAGIHKLSFVATDGVRSTTATLDVPIE